MPVREGKAQVTASCQIFVNPVDLVEGVTIRGDGIVVRLDKRLHVKEGSELALSIHLNEVMVFGPEGSAIR